MGQNPEIIRKLEEWAKNHPKPDKPLMAVGFNSYSPNQLVEKVKEKSKIGKSL